jgi:hypothetical protein
MEWQTAGDATRETELVALWGEPFDHLTRQAVDDFRSFPPPWRLRVQPTALR